MKVRLLRPRPILENGVIGNTRGFEPLILSSKLSSPAKYKTNGDEFYEKILKKTNYKRLGNRKRNRDKKSKRFLG